MSDLLPRNLNDHLIREWHLTKNGSLSPHSVTKGSSKKVWWVCDNGHDWIATIHSRSEGSGCPHCKIRIYKQPITALLLKEWHPFKNIGVQVDKLTSGSNKLVWWLCSRGHEFQAQINHRSKGRKNCPECNGFLIDRKKGPISTGLSEQWHPTKNVDLQPSMFTSGSSKKVWWVCAKGHDWQAKIESRSRGTGCPTCARNNNTPIPEGILAEWHPTLNPMLNPLKTTKWSTTNVWWICKDGHFWRTSVNNRSSGYGCPTCVKIKNGKLKPIDENLAQEWHNSKNDLDIASMFGCLSKKEVWWVCKKGHEWQSQIYLRSQGKKCPYCPKELKNPMTENLLKEWHPTKNYALQAESVSNKSKKSVWWLCNNQHEWKASVTSRSKGFRKCPICFPSNYKGRAQGKNYKGRAQGKPTLDTNVELAAEWHPTKNHPLLPEMFTTGSGKRVWWQCKSGHEWEVDIKNRASAHSGCPHCRKAKSMSISSELLNQWHPTRNVNVDPLVLTSGSSKKAWWVCEQGHEWMSYIFSRSNGAGCPFCTKRPQRYEEYTTIEYTQPTIESLLPKMVKGKSHFL